MAEEAPLFFDSGDEADDAAAQNLLASDDEHDSDMEIIASTSSSNKRKLEREDTDVVVVKAEETRCRRYIGEIMINGWSTVNGKGYASSGEQVIIERDKSVQKKPQAKKVCRSVRNE